MAIVKYGRDDEGGRDALGMTNRSINIWDRSEPKLAWSKKSSSYVEKKCPIFLLFGISNILIFTVLNVLHWVNFLSIKILSNIFCFTFCWGREYVNASFIAFIFYYFQQVLFTLRVSSLILLLNDDSVDIIGG